MFNEHDIVLACASRATEITIAGHKVLCANAPVFPLAVAEFLARHHPFGVAWEESSSSDDNDNVYRTYWLSRSANEPFVDIAEIAQQYGGGGKDNWAMFQVPATGSIGIFSAGKLSNDDQGDIRLAIYCEDNLVHIDFGKDLSWLAFSSQQAIEFANLIIKSAQKVLN